MSTQRLAMCVREQPGRMLAWRVHSYGGLADLRLETVRRPMLRAPAEVLVKVKASAINPIDLAMLDGYGHRALGAWRRAETLARSAGEGGGAGVDASDALPLIVGREFTGEVVRAGPRARYAPGDPVWGVVPPHRTGAHAQYVAVDQDWICPLPSSMKAVASGGGGALYCGLTALSALRTAGLGAGARGRGARVLVLGCGGVGQAAVQLLRREGARVTVACSQSTGDVARCLGAADVLEREAPDYDRLLEDRGPYDVILDTAGLGGAEAGARNWQFSRYVTLSSPMLRETDALGLCAGAATAAFTLITQNLSVARMSLTASSSSPSPEGSSPRSIPALPPQVRWAFFTPSVSGLQMLTRLANRGEFIVVVDEIFPWWQAADAYQRMSRGHMRGKIIMDYTAPQPEHLDLATTTRTTDSTVQH